MDETSRCPIGRPAGGHRFIGAAKWPYCRDLGKVSTAPNLSAPIPRRGTKGGNTEVLHQGVRGTGVYA